MKNISVKSWSGRRRHGGQALVEAAAVFVFILLPLTFGIVQFGLFYNATNTVNHLARDGVRFAAVHCIDMDDPTTPTIDEGSDSYILSFIQTDANNSFLKYADLDSIAITPDRSVRHQYQQVSVTISYNLNKRSFMPFLNVGYFKPGVYTKTETAMIE